MTLYMGDNKIFHILNRGIEKREVFFDKKDYERFIINLFRLNSKKSINQKGFGIFNEDIKRERLVEIFKWALMPNHYHLLLQENEPGGAVEFTKRLGNAYTKYINIKYDRSGYLFQNKAQIIQLIDEPHKNQVPFYIDLNPLDLEFPSWKDRDLASKDIKYFDEFLKSYTYSSYYDFENFDRYPNLLNKELFYEIFETNREKYKGELFNLPRRRGRSTWQVE